MKYGLLMLIAFIVAFAFSMSGIKDKNGNIIWNERVGVLLRLILEIGTLIMAISSANEFYGTNAGFALGLAYILITISPVFIGDGSREGKAKRSA